MFTKLNGDTELIAALAQGLVKVSLQGLPPGSTRAHATERNALVSPGNPDAYFLPR